MLVLTRKTHQRIQIDDQIFIEVVSIGHNKVKLAISAPGNVSIRREELPLESESDGDLQASFSEDPAPSRNRR